MGERELCKLEVIGSIPFSSTSLRAGSELRLGKPGVFPEARSKRTIVLFLLSSAFARKGQGLKQTSIDIVKEDLRGLVMRADVCGTLQLSKQDRIRPCHGEAKVRLRPNFEQPMSIRTGLIQLTCSGTTSI